MQGFTTEANSTVAVDDSKGSLNFQAHLWKLGTGNGWCSNQLPFVIAQGKYKIDVDLIEIANSHVMIGFVQQGTDLKTAYVGSVANSWSYYCSNGNKYVGGANTAVGPAAKKGDKITMKFDFDEGTVRVYKCGSLIGLLLDIPVKNNNLKFAVSLYLPGDHAFVDFRMKLKPPNAS